MLMFEVENVELELDDLTCEQDLELLQTANPVLKSLSDLKKKYIRPVFRRKTCSRPESGIKSSSSGFPEPAVTSVSLV